MKVPISRYTSSSWMREEKEKLWDNVWLLVTHQSMFPEEGSTQRFTIMGKEIVVVRHANGFSAFRNRCPHRGTPLVSKSGSFSHFRCPYHHWTFALDGRILSMPQCEKDDTLSLEELPCEQALGFIWMNFDRNASPLKTYLSDILAPLENYRLAEQHCHSIWHSPLSANWKTSVDAHNEVYHLPALHPEILGIIDERKAKTQCFSLHAKMTVPMFTSPQRPLGHRAKEYAQNVYEQMQLPYPIDRQRVTQVLQKQSALPLREEELTQTQLIYIFPNVQLNLRHNEIMVFRHLPDPDHPQQCRFTQFLLRSVPAEQRPEEREISALDKRYGSITGVDLRIVSHVQKGLQNDPNGYIHLTKNEELIRHMHQTLSTMDLRDE